MPHALERHRAVELQQRSYGQQPHARTGHGHERLECQELEEEHRGEDLEEQELCRQELTERLPAPGS